MVLNSSISPVSTSGSKSIAQAINKEAQTIMAGKTPAKDKAIELLTNNVSNPTPDPVRSVTANFRSSGQAAAQAATSSTPGTDPMAQMMMAMNKPKASDEQASAPKPSSNQSSAKFNEAISKMAQEMKSLQKQLNEKIDKLTKDGKIDSKDKKDANPTDKELHSKIKNLNETIDKHFQFKDGKPTADFDPKKVSDSAKDLSTFLSNDRYKGDDFQDLKTTVGEIYNKAQGAIKEQESQPQPSTPTTSPETTTPTEGGTKDLPRPPIDEPPSKVTMLDTDKLFAETDTDDISETPVEEPEIDLSDLS